MFQTLFSMPGEGSGLGLKEQKFLVPKTGTGKTIKWEGAGREDADKL